MLSVEIKYHTFESVSHQKQLDRATNQDEDIYQEAILLFRELWDGNPIRLLGIRSAKLAEEGEPEQLTIFDPQLCLIYLKACLHLRLMPPDLKPVSLCLTCLL